LREFFRDCKYINGYLQTVVEDSVAKVVCKYIPDELFKYFGTSTYKLQYMFYNNVLPMAGYFDADLDIVTPFRNMTSTNLIYKDISAIFARCQWLNSNQLTDAFKTLFLQKAVGAFSRRPVSGTYSGDGYLIPSRSYYGDDLGDTYFQGYEEVRLAAN